MTRALLLTLLTPALLLAQPERRTEVRNLTEWSDDIQIESRAPDGTVWPVGPYANYARAFGHIDEPWAMIRTDRSDAFLRRDWQGLFVADWTPFTRHLGATLYGDFAAYRRAWWIGSRFDVFGPACACWTGVQGSIHATFGLTDWPGPWGSYEQLLMDAARWDDAVGRHADWSQAYVVTDVRRELEFITGAPILREIPPVDPPDWPGEPSNPVPEPNTLLLMVWGAVLMTLAWYGRKP